MDEIEHRMEEILRIETAKVWDFERWFETNLKYKGVSHKPLSIGKMDKFSYAKPKVDERKLRRLDEERQREEAEECTFAPKFATRARKNNNKRDMLERSEEAQNSMSRRYFAALYDAFLNSQKEVKECTFRPDVGSTKGQNRVKYTGEAKHIVGVRRFVELQQKGRALKEGNEEKKKAVDVVPLPYPKRGVDEVRFVRADISDRISNHQKKLRTALDGIVNELAFPFHPAKRSCKSQTPRDVRDGSGPFRKKKAVMRKSTERRNPPWNKF